LKTYDQDLKNNAKKKVEVHYLSIKIKISTTRHKQHFEIILNSSLGMVAKW
jgi:uncharacterized GH25 family protein